MFVFIKFLFFLIMFLCAPVYSSDNSSAPNSLPAAKHVDIKSTIEVCVVFSKTSYKTVKVEPASTIKQLRTLILEQEPKLTSLTLLRAGHIKTVSGRGILPFLTYKMSDPADCSGDSSIGKDRVFFAHKLKFKSNL